MASGLALKSEELQQRVKSAFALATYPGDDQLVVVTGGAHLECEQIRAAFQGKRWQHLPLKFLRYHASSLSFLTPEAFRYYLPAFLLAALQSYKKADMVPFSLVFHLTPPAEGDPERSRFDQVVTGLTQEQKVVIATFLQYMLEEHAGDFPLGDVQTALERYWGAYL